ncbi:hypothetical protein LCGC14_2496730 [marine sediment metagenome]|uniref:Uncharacterized protein n=1 Tax=marine sediment metagenome TaxID=412755 RepID=A0A0F9B330_9ZZZZ
MKRCSTCKRELPLSEFSKDRATKDGLQYQCKSCAKEYYRQYCQSEKGKVAGAGATKKYRGTEKGKATRVRYQRSLKGKAAHKKYEQSPGRKAIRTRANKKWLNTIEGYLCYLFHSIKRRCTNSKATGYKRYGAKGVECRFEDADDFICYVMGVMGFNTIDKIRGFEIHRTGKHYQMGGIEFLTRAEHQAKHKKMRAKHKE